MIPVKYPNIHFTNSEFNNIYFHLLCVLFSKETKHLFKQHCSSVATTIFEGVEPLYNVGNSTKS